MKESPAASSQRRPDSAPAHAARAAEKKAEREAEEAEYWAWQSGVTEKMKAREPIFRVRGGE